MNKHLLAIILMVVLAFINGCGTTAKVKAKNDMEKSQAAYIRCLDQYPDEPSKCEALRRAYEADLEAYREASKGVTPSTTIFIESGIGRPGK